MSGPDGRRLLVALVAISLVGALAVGLGATSVAAEPAEPDLECIGEDNGAVYVTDSGLEVIENDDDITFGSFPDDETVEFQDGVIALSASGESEGRLDSGTGDVTCLADVDASDHAITVAPDAENDLTVAGEFDGLAFRDVVFDPDDEGTDIVYEADSLDSLTIDETGLEDGEMVRALDADDGNELDDATVDNGAIVFEDLPNNAVELDLTTEEESEEPFFDIELLDTNEPVTEGDDLAVEIAVENTGDEGDTQDIELAEFDGTVVDEQSLTLDGDEEETVTLTWETESGDTGTGDIAVTSEDDDATAEVTVAESDASLAIEEFADEFPDGDEGDDYGEVSVTVEETEDVETENLETSLEIAGNSGGVIFEETVDDRELAGESDEFSFDVGEIGDADEYTATVTAEADNAAAVDREETFTVADQPDGSFFDVEITDTTEPVTEGDDLAVEIAVENTGEEIATQDIELAEFDGTVVDEQSLTLDGDEEETVTLTWETESGDTGTGDIAVTSEDDDATAEVTVAEEFDPSPDPEPEPDPETTVEIEPAPTTGETLITIDPVTAGESISVESETALSGITPVGLDNMTVDAETEQQFWLNVSTFGADLSPSFDAADLDTETETIVGNGAESFENETGTVPAGYLLVDNSLSDGDVSDVTFEFSIDQSRLDELGVEPESVQLYHNETDGLSSLPTDHVNTTETTYHFEGTAPGLSLFAVGTGATQLSVSDLTVDETTITAGETATVTATVDNRGETAVDRTLELEANRDVVTTETVSVDGTDSRTVTFSFQPTDIGEYDIEVADAGTESVAVDVQPEQAAFQLSDLRVEDSTITQGDTVTVSATVRNDGDEQESQEILLDIDGTDRTETVTLAGDESEDIELDIETTELEPGDYTYSLATDDDELTGDLTVEADNGTDDDGTGFGVFVALLAILGVAFIGLRRRTK